MQRMIQVKSLFIVALVIIWMSACNETGQDMQLEKKSQEGSAPLVNETDKKDVQCLADAYTAVLNAITMADTAKALATTDNVRDIASRIATENIRLAGQLSELAAAKQIALPAGLTDGDKETIQAFPKEGIAFDKNYLSKMVKLHKTMAEIFAICSNECTDTQIRKWFFSSISEVRDYLELVENAEKKLHRYGK